MTIQHLSQRGVSRAQIARTLCVTEGSMRYHLRRQASGATDGRKLQAFSAAPWHEAILTWLDSREDGPLNLPALHAWLVEERGYTGSRRSVQRYYAARFPQPKIRARRRVGTPPGAQAQVDWAEFRGVRIGDEVVDLYALHVQLSWSRYDAVVWSLRKDQLAWHHAHNEALRRLGGVSATLRVDNEKTAVSRGAGAWGEINPQYRRYAEAVRFHVDACPPRSPGHKGKVERRIRDHRLQADPCSRAWSSLVELQAWTDQQMLASAKRRVCPATGTSVLEAYQQEKPMLAPLPILPEPFDLVATRTVGRDGLVAFEGRQYSVLFPFVLRAVEVRGCAGKVQIVAEGGIVASWPRHSAARLLVDPIHYEGEATDRVLLPPPLGRMGKKLQEIAALQPQRRPIDLYAALAEVARLGLLRASESLATHLTEAIKEEVPPHRFLDRLLEDELGCREERRVRTTLRLSNLPTGQTLASFDFSFQPGIERSRIETLATGAWIREKQNLLIQGPPGAGKSHLAIALGVKAVENGFSVAFFRLEELLAAMRRDAEVAPARLRRRKHVNVALLVVDEVGFEPMSRQDTSLLFRLVSYRYQRGSIVLTTNKGIRDWPEILAGDEVLATAILDRLLHRSHVLDIKGRSYRLRDLERAAVSCG